MLGRQGDSAEPPRAEGGDLNDISTTGLSSEELVGPLAGKLLRFIGVDRRKIYSVSEEMHYMAVLAAIFIGPLVTSSMFVYAAHFVYGANLLVTAILTCVVFVVYVSIEYGIASQPTPKRVLARLKMGGLRLFLVIVVSFLVGELVAEQYFATEVAVAVTDARVSQSGKSAQKVAATADENRQIAQLQADEATTHAEIDRRNGEVAAAQARVDGIQKLIDAEDKGLLGGRESGCGPYCEAKKAELQVAVADRSRITADVATATAALEGDLTRMDDSIAALQKRINDRADDAVREANREKASPAERFAALNRVTWGHGNWARLLIRIAITLALMLLEAAAVILKLSKQTRHDAEVIASEAVGQRRTVYGYEKELADLEAQASRDADDRFLNNYTGAASRRAMRQKQKQLTEYRGEELLAIAKTKAEIAKLKMDMERLGATAEMIEQLARLEDQLEHRIGFANEQGGNGSSAKEEYRRTRVP